MNQRYAFSWTDYRGMYAGVEPEIVHQDEPDMSVPFLTNFVGMAIIMIPVSIIAYWIWF